MPTLTELSNSRELMLNLTLRELRGKYKRSALGWFWSLLNPLATMVIFTVVFRLVLRIEPPEGDPSGLDNFALFLLCALLPWNFLANGLSGGMGSLVGNANLIRKVYFPREVLVASNVASWVVSLFIEMAMLAAFLLIVGNFVLPMIPGVLLVIAIQTVFVLGIALLLSVLNVYFRDIQHLFGIAVQFWFYATPVIYPISMVREATEGRGWLFDLYMLNPMTRFVEVYRDLLYDVRLPALGDLLYLSAVSLAVLALGIVVFNRLEPKLAEEL